MDTDAEEAENLDNLDYVQYDRLWDADTKSKLEEMGLSTASLSQLGTFLKRQRASGDNLQSYGRRKLEPSELEGIDEETKYRLSLLRPSYFEYLAISYDHREGEKKKSANVFIADNMFSSSPESEVDKSSQLLQYPTKEDYRKTFNFRRPRLTDLNYASPVNEVALVDVIFDRQCDIPGEKFVPPFTFEVSSHSFSIGIFEPFFCTISLWDLMPQTPLKLTENFHIGLHDDAILKLIGASDEFYPSNLAKKALISLPNSVKRDTLYLVIQLEKVFQEDVANHQKKYFKISLKDQQKKEFEKKQGETCKLAAQSFRQPFAFNVIPMNQMTDSVPNQIPLFPYPSIAKNFPSTITEFFKSKTKLKAFPYSFLNCIVTPSPDTAIGETIPFIRSFDHGIPYPVIDIYHDLYFYPTSLMLLDSKLILLELAIYNDAQHAKKLKLFYTDFYGKEAFADTRRLVITNPTAQKKHLLCDEVKIKLPLQLTKPDALHMVVSVYELSTSSKLSTSKTPIYYAVVPLAKLLLDYAKVGVAELKTSLAHGTGDDAKLTKAGASLLPSGISSSFYDASTSSSSASQMPTAENNTFQFRITSVSSLLPASSKMSDFMKSCKHVKGETPELLDIKAIDPRHVIQDLPFLLDRLLTVIGNSSSSQFTASPDPECRQEIGSQAFYALLETFDTEFRNSHQNSSNPNKPLFFHSFFKYQYSDNSSTKDTAVMLTKYWYQLFLFSKNTEEASPFHKYYFSLSIRFAPVLLFVIKKLYCCLALSSTPEDTGNRGKIFSSKSTAYLVGLMRCFSLFMVAEHEQSLTDVELPALNMQIAKFLKDMMFILNPSSSFEMIHTYIRDWNTAKLGYFKSVVIHNVISHPHYFLFNLPINRRNISLAFSKNYLQKHFLSGILIEHVQSTLQFLSKSNELGPAANNDSKKLSLSRHQKYYGLHILLTTILSDASRELGALYFPVLPIISKHMSCNKNMDDDEKWILLMIALAVVNQTSDVIMNSWWRVESVTNIKHYFHLLGQILTFFDNYCRRTKSVNISMYYSSLHSSNSVGPETLQRRASRHTFQPLGKFLVREALSGNNQSSVELRFKEDYIGSTRNSDSKPLVTAASNPLRKPFGMDLSKKNDQSSSPKDGTATTVQPSRPQKALPPKSLSSVDLKASIDCLSIDGSESSGKSGTPKVPSTPSPAVFPTAARSFGENVTRGRRFLDSNNQKDNYYVEVFDIVLANLTLFLNPGCPISSYLDRNSDRKSDSSINSTREVANILDAWDVFLMFFEILDSNCFFLRRALFVLIDLISEQKDILFINSDTSILGRLSYALMKLSTSSNEEIKKYATIGYILLLKYNYEKCNSFARVEFQSKMAITKLISDAETNSMDYSLLEESIGITKAEISSIIPHSKSMMNQFSETMSSIISEHLKLSKFKSDPGLMVDSYFDISREMTTSPVSRLQWLDIMSDQLASLAQYLEAGLTKILSAILVIKYLILFGQWDQMYCPMHSLAFAKLCPDIELLANVPELDEIVALKTEILSARYFSVAGFQSLLSDAVELFKSSKEFEYSLRASKMLANIYHENEDYENLQSCYQSMSSISEKLTKGDAANDKVSPNYYRVAFYGSQFGSGDNESIVDEFIYKCAPDVRVHNLVKDLEVQFGEAYNTSSKVAILPNNVIPTPGMLVDSNTIYIQVAAVLPSYASEKKPELYFYQNFNISQFVLEQPFTLDGKSHGDVTEQYLRRTIFTTEYSYPCIKYRLRIAKKEWVQLAPIEKSMTEIERKFLAIQDIVAQGSKVSVKRLQMEIQGSLLVEVNAGPIVLAESFIKVEYPYAGRQKIIEMLVSLSGILKKAVELNEILISEDQMKLQAAFKKGWEKFEEQTQKLKQLNESLAPKVSENFSISRKHGTLVMEMIEGNNNVDENKKSSFSRATEWKSKDKTNVQVPTIKLYFNQQGNQVSGVGAKRRMAINTSHFYGPEETEAKKEGKERDKASLANATSSRGTFGILGKLDGKDTGK